MNSAYRNSEAGSCKQAFLFGPLYEIYERRCITNVTCSTVRIAVYTYTCDCISVTLVQLNFTVHRSISSPENSAFCLRGKQAGYTSRLVDRKWRGRGKLIYQFRFTPVASVSPSALRFPVQLLALTFPSPPGPVSGRQSTRIKSFLCFSVSGKNYTERQTHGCPIIVYSAGGIGNRA